MMISLSLAAVTAKAVGEVPDYFRSLGFEVDWDFNRHRGNHWYEIYDGKELLAQIDKWAPLVQIKRDLPLLAYGKPAPGEPGEVNWEVRGEFADLRRIADRMVPR